MHTIPVSDTVRDLLRRSVVTVSTPGPLLKLPPGQLARPVYEEVNRVLAPSTGCS